MAIILSLPSAVMNIKSDNVSKELGTEDSFKSLIKLWGLENSEGKTPVKSGWQLGRPCLPLGPW